MSNSATPISPIDLTLPALGEKTMRLRPLVDQDEDRERVRKAYRLMSPKDRMNRFWSQNEKLSEAMITRLVDGKQEDHVVWAALDPSDPDLPGFGAASYWREPHRPELAEFSVTIGSPFQRNGLATMLLSLLWVIARHDGVHHFVAHVRADNRPAVRWLAALGGDNQQHPGEIRFEWELESAAELREKSPSSSTIQRIAQWIEQLEPLLFPR